MNKLNVQWNIDPDLFPIFLDNTLSESGELDSQLNKVNLLLKEKKPYTYIISKLNYSDFLVSYIEENQEIKHTRFNKTKDNQWRYLNGQDHIVPNLNELIRKIMNLAENMPDPTPLIK